MTARQPTGAEAPGCSASWPVRAEEYRLVSTCGKGGSSTVYCALCVPRGEMVTVKVVRLPMYNISAEVEAGSREAHVMAAYEHQHVLSLHCAFMHKAELWLVLPYMEGGSMADILKAAGGVGLPEVLIASIMLPVAQALAYIHQQGGMHRDIKAGNILVSSSKGIVLADLGSAATPDRKAGWVQSRSTKTTFVGSPCWMAPEVVQGISSYDSSADIWSFGITLLELACGKPPLATDRRYSATKVMSRILAEPPPQLGSIQPREYSRLMHDLAGQCLRKEPGERPTAQQLLQHAFFRQAKGTAWATSKLLSQHGGASSEKADTGSGSPLWARLHLSGWRGSMGRLASWSGVAGSSPACVESTSAEASGSPGILRGVLPTVAEGDSGARDQQQEQACDTGRDIAPEDLDAITKAAAAAGLPIVAASATMGVAEAPDMIAAPRPWPWARETGVVRQFMVFTLCMADLQTVR